MANFTNVPKNSITPLNDNKRGAGWRYEEDEINYEMSILYYNTYGLPITFSNVVKNSITPSNQTKN